MNCVNAPVAPLYVQLGQLVPMRMFAMPTWLGAMLGPLHETSAHWFPDESTTKYDTSVTFTVPLFLIYIVAFVLDRNE